MSGFHSKYTSWKKIGIFLKCIHIIKDFFKKRKLSVSSFFFMIFVVVNHTDKYLQKSVGYAKMEGRHY